MRLKIFNVVSFVFEMLGLLIITTLSLMFFIASIENIKTQTTVKEFISRGIFEFEDDDVLFYYVPTTELVEDTIISEKRGNDEFLWCDLGNKGDIFIMPQSRIDYVPFSMQFITYLFGGHAGVVLEDSQIIEAMGGSADTIEISPSDLLYEKRTVVGLRVNTSFDVRKQAAENAKTLNGEKYNYSFIFNTKNKYYCTDLCARVYQEEFGLNYDLDKNNFYTTTQDLYQSKDTYISFVKFHYNDKTYVFYLKTINE